jgi:hypothetical protein
MLLIPDSIYDSGNAATGHPALSKAGAQARYDTNERLDKACKLVAAMTRKEHISRPFGGASVAVA